MNHADRCECCEEPIDEADAAVVVAHRRCFEVVLQERAEALKGRLLVPLIDVERDIAHMSTKVTLELPYREFDEERDRRAFRRKLAEKLNRMGDLFMAAWEQRHGERADE